MELSYRIVAGVEKGRIGSIRVEPGRPVWIGRADESYGTSIVLPDQGVSALHACVVLEADGWPALCDNRSTNGLFRKGQSVSHATFRSGERFQVGRGGPEVEFFYAEEPGARAPVPPPMDGRDETDRVLPPAAPAHAFHAAQTSPYPIAPGGPVPAAAPPQRPPVAPAPPPHRPAPAPTPLTPMQALPPLASMQPLPPPAAGWGQPPPPAPAAHKPHPSLPARTRTAQTERARKAVTAEGYVPIERIPGRDPIIVFRAKRPGIDHEVMVEVLLHNSEYETPDERRFLRAARLSAKLHHPNVIALYDARITDDYDLLVFESLRGKTLREEIAETGALTPARVLSVAGDVARGLARVHELGFVHRGLTPESITTTDDGHVKLLALGLLRPAVQDDESQGDDGTGTMPGDILGSLAHMAPEQTSNPKLVDARADVYGLGAVMYHALAGRPPFADVTRLVSGGDPQPIGQLVPTTPAPLVQLVTRCMARDPARRFANGAEVQAEIERAAAQLRSPAAGAAPGAHRGSGAPTMVGLPPGVQPGFQQGFQPGFAFSPNFQPAINPGFQAPGLPGGGASAAAALHGVSSAGFFAGRLRGMQIVELLQMVELHDEAGTLEIMADAGPRGQLSFAGGRVVAATCGALSGEDAVYALLAVQRGFFRMAYGKVEPDPSAPTIGAILFEHMRRTDEGSG